MRLHVFVVPDAPAESVSLLLGPYSYLAANVLLRSTAAEKVLKATMRGIVGRTARATLERLEPSVPQKVLDQAEEEIEKEVWSTLDLSRRTLVRFGPALPSHVAYMARSITRKADVRRWLRMESLDDAESSGRLVPRREAGIWTSGIELRAELLPAIAGALRALEDRDRRILEGSCCSGKPAAEMAVEERVALARFYRLMVRACLRFLTFRPLRQVLRSIGWSDSAADPARTVKALLEYHAECMEDGRRKTEDGRRKTEDGRRKTEDGRRKRRRGGESEASRCFLEMDLWPASGDRATILVSWSRLGNLQGECDHDAWHASDHLPDLRWPHPGRTCSRTERSSGAREKGSHLRSYGPGRPGVADKFRHAGIRAVRDCSGL